jgi:hypothetical protein
MMGMVIQRLASLMLDPSSRVSNRSPAVMGMASWDNLEYTLNFKFGRVVHDHAAGHEHKAMLEQEMQSVSPPSRLKASELMELYTAIRLISPRKKAVIQITRSPRSLSRRLVTVVLAC